MIEPKTKKVWTTKDGTEHTTLIAAQEHEIGALFAAEPPETTPARIVTSNAPAILEILGKKERKPRTPKPVTPKPATSNKSRNKSTATPPVSVA